MPAVIETNRIVDLVENDTPEFGNFGSDRFSFDSSNPPPDEKACEAPLGKEVVVTAVKSRRESTIALEAYWGTAAHFHDIPTLPKMFENAKIDGDQVLLFRYRVESRSDLLRQLGKLFTEPGSPFVHADIVPIANFIRSMPPELSDKE